MPGILVVCVILLPWVGAVAVWSVRDTRPRAATQPGDWIQPAGRIERNCITV